MEICSPDSIKVHSGYWTTDNTRAYLGFLNWISYKTNLYVHLRWDGSSLSGYQGRSLIATIFIPLCGQGTDSVNIFRLAQELSMMIFAITQALTTWSRVKDNYLHVFSMITPHVSHRTKLQELDVQWLFLKRHLYTCTHPKGNQDPRY